MLLVVVLHVVVGVVVVVAVVFVVVVVCAVCVGCDSADNVVAVLSPTVSQAYTYTNDCLWSTQNGCRK